MKVPGYDKAQKRIGSRGRLASQPLSSSVAEDNRSFRIGKVWCSAASRDSATAVRLHLICFYSLRLSALRKCDGGGIPTASCGRGISTPTNLQQSSSSTYPHESPRTQLTGWSILNLSVAPGTPSGRTSSAKMAFPLPVRHLLRCSPHTLPRDLRQCAQAISAILPRPLTRYLAVHRAQHVVGRAPCCGRSPRTRDAWSLSLVIAPEGDLQQPYDFLRLDICALSGD